MLKKSNGFTIDIPEPLCEKETEINGRKFVRSGFRLANKGDVVYSFFKNGLVVRENDSRTPFWIYIPIFNDGENILTDVDLNGIEFDSSENEIEEYTEELERKRLSLEKKRRLSLEKKERLMMLEKRELEKIELRRKDDESFEREREHLLEEYARNSETKVFQKLKNIMKEKDIWRNKYDYWCEW